MANRSQRQAVTRGTSAESASATPRPAGGAASVAQRIERRRRSEVDTVDSLVAEFARLPARSGLEGAEMTRPERPDEPDSPPVPSDGNGPDTSPEGPAAENDDPLLEACRVALRAVGVEFPSAPMPITDASIEPRVRIEAIARAAEVRVRPVRVPARAWTPDAEPLVALRRGAATTCAVALLPGVRIHGAVARELEPIAYCFTRPLPPRPLRLRDLLGLAGAGLARAGVGLALTWVAAGAMGLLIPALTASLVDDVVPAAGHGAVTATVLALGVATVALLAFDLGAAFVRIRLQARISYRVTSAIADRLLSLPTPFFRRYAVGDLLMRAGIGDDERNGLLTVAVGGALAAVFSLSSLAALLWIDPRLGLIAAGAGAALLGVSRWLFASRSRLEREVLSSGARQRSFLLQLFGAISAIRSSGAETWTFARWARLFRQRRELEFASSRINGVLAMANEVVPLVCTGLFFWAFASARAASAGGYFAATQAFAVFLGGMMRLGEAMAASACVIPLLARTQPILSASPERTRGGRISGALTGGVELRNLAFRYSASGPRVLEDVSVRIERGQFVAVVGASGSGKSTLVRLLLGFERPECGEILFDGLPIGALDVVELRRQIGTVLQHDQLMTGSIYENIAASRPVSTDEAQHVARMAGLERELKAWPMGLHTLVTQGARAFSGGERQRMMIARALAGRPRLLVFDEATSALDNAVQAEVMRNLARLEMTRIVVAHRLSTIRDADQILVFERGRIVERGDYPSLLARGGVLARLVRRQAAEIPASNARAAAASEASV